jgi:hypothetical protein
MSDIILPINGNVAEAAAAALADDGKFHFSLTADDAGITGFKFRKDVERVFGVLLFALETVNGTFDQPFPCVGDFCRHLGEVADKVEAAYKQRQEEANGQAANDAGPSAPEAA